MRRFAGIVQTYWEEAHASLWFLPSILVILSISLSFLLLWFDRTYAEIITAQLPWLFSGTASSAQQLLGVIAASTITVISIAFSLTILAMQQASAQYTPRVLRNFTSDKGNQLVLGVYIATFVYALLILRAVREADSTTGAFVPSVSASVGILLALLCIGLLVYFINHVATSLQATTVIRRVHTDLLDQINTLYPADIGKPAPQHHAISQRLAPDSQVRADKGGFVVRIDEQALESLRDNSIKQIEVPISIGEFVATGQIIATVTGSKNPTGAIYNEIHSAVIINNQRSITDDPLFAIRQLVDIAMRGLSPGVNDITTSNYCIYFLGDALGLLAQKEFPQSVRTLTNSDAKLYLNKPSWEDFVFHAFRQIMQYIDTNRQVLDVLVHTLERIIDQLPNKERAEPISSLINELENSISVYTKLSSDKSIIKGQLRHLRKKISLLPA